MIFFFFFFSVIINWWVILYTWKNIRIAGEGNGGTMTFDLFAIIKILHCKALMTFIFNCITIIETPPPPYFCAFEYV